MSGTEAHVIATFAVDAGTTAEFPLDVEGMTDQQIVDAAFDAAQDYVDTSVCHQCGHNIVDPQSGEMTGLTVDGREIDLDCMRLPSP